MCCHYVSSESKEEEAKRNRAWTAITPCRDRCTFHTIRAAGGRWTYSSERPAKGRHVNIWRWRKKTKIQTGNADGEQSWARLFSKRNTFRMQMPTDMQLLDKVLKNIKKTHIQNKVEKEMQRNQQITFTVKNGFDQTFYLKAKGLVFQ